MNVSLSMSTIMFQRKLNRFYYCGVTVSFHLFRPRHLSKVNCQRIEGLVSKKRGKSLRSHRKNSLSTITTFPLSFPPLKKMPHEFHLDWAGRHLIPRKIINHGREREENFVEMRRRKPASPPGKHSALTIVERCVCDDEDEGGYTATAKPATLLPTDLLETEIEERGTEKERKAS